MKMLPFYEQGKWGYMDERRNCMIVPCYQHCKCFSEGVAAVCVEGRYFYINESGQIAIPGIFMGAGDFTGGMAVIQKDGRSGVIDRVGNIIIPLEYDNLYPFDENNTMFCAQKINGKWGIVDNINKKRLPFVFDYINGFESDIWWNTTIGRKHVFYDNKWQRQRTFAYDSMTPFFYGMSVVSNDGYYGVIDKMGVEVLPLKYREISICGAKRLSVRIQESQQCCFYYPSEGSFGDIHFDHALNELGNGMIFVCQNGLYALYDRQEYCVLNRFAEEIQLGIYGKYHRYWLNEAEMGYLVVENDGIYSLGFNTLIKMVDL